MSNEDTSPESIEDQNSLGEIKINHSVIAGIVRLAALEINGVSAVGGSFVDGLTEIFSKKESDRGVKVNEDENGYYVIEIRLLMEFGTDLAKTAYNVQMAVRNRLNQMTGKQVSRVNVVIDGVKVPEPPDPKKTQSGWPNPPTTD